MLQRMASPDDELDEAPVPVPLDGTLDLHAFRPQEAREVVLSYLEACREAGVLEVRIVHGKGSGTLKRLVRAELARLPWVVAVREGGALGGGWGATLVDLLPQEREPSARLVDRKE